jgi:hypothetical protein
VRGRPAATFGNSAESLQFYPSRCISLPMATFTTASSTCSGTGQPAAPTCPTDYSASWDEVVYTMLSVLLPRFGDGVAGVSQAGVDIVLSAKCGHRPLSNREAVRSRPKRLQLLRITNIAVSQAAAAKACMSAVAGAAAAQQASSHLQQSGVLRRHCAGLNTPKGTLLWFHTSIGGSNLCHPALWTYRYTHNTSLCGVLCCWAVKCQGSCHL